MIQAYNYLMLANLPAKREVLYPAKNRVELRRVYNSIVNLSSRSPIYKIDISQENQKYAIDIKESALELQAKIKNMQDLDSAGFLSKKVSVSDSELIEAQLLTQETGTLPNTIRIKVNQLAKAQVNRGRELMNASYAFPSGTYEFNINIKDETYPLTYVHPERMSNQDTLKRIAGFLNNNVPGIIVGVEKIENKDYSRMMIASDLSGRFGDRVFSFDEDETYGEGIVSFLGLDRVETAATYSEFELNDMKKQTATNAFTLENTLHITLKNTKENPVTLRITPDSDKILKSVNSVISTYNRIIRVANSRLKNYNDYSASKLINEMKGLEKLYHEELSACGIESKENGMLGIDDLLAVQAAEDGGMESLFTRENGFMARLIDKSEAIAINPMEYLEKTVVLYPDSSKNPYKNPYVTSMYSGMLFSSYC